MPKYLFSLAVLTVFLIAGCESSQSLNEVNPDLARSDYELFQAVYEDEAFIGNQEIIVDLLRAYDYLNLTGSQIVEAYKTNDMDVISELIGIPKDDLISMWEEMNSNYKALEERHEILQDQRAVESCSPIGESTNMEHVVDLAIKNYRNGILPFETFTEPALGKVAQKSSCDFWQLGVCGGLSLAACIASGPAGIIVCPLGAYYCVCKHCYGPRRDQIC